MTEQLVGALKQLEIAGGREDDDDEDGKSPSEYLEELLAVGDARYELGQYDRAGSIYYRAYYAAIAGSSYFNDPKVFPICSKMIHAWMKTNQEHYILQAHGMAQQSSHMPGHPPFVREDLIEVEALMKKKGMPIQRFGMF